MHGQDNFPHTPTMFSVSHLLRPVYMADITTTFPFSNIYEYEFRKLSFTSHEFEIQNTSY